MRYLSYRVTLDHGCDLVQGFHLGRPVPPEALLEQLRNAAPDPPKPTAGSPA